MICGLRPTSQTEPNDATELLNSATAIDFPREARRCSALSTFGVSVSMMITTLEAADLYLPIKRHIQGKYIDCRFTQYPKLTALRIFLNQFPDYGLAQSTRLGHTR